MARVSSINADEFIEFADKLVDGESPDAIRNAFEERIRRRESRQQDAFQKSTDIYTPFRENEKSRYAAFAGKTEDKLNFIEKTYNSESSKSSESKAPQANSAEADSSKKSSKYNSDEDKNTNPAGKELSENEKKEVEKLKKIDRKVRAHEMAHQAAGAGLVRGKSFTYTTGPDGKRYATGGEVKIDISAVPGDPEATIRKMEQVRRAALAPSDPSSTDRAVAAKASQLEAKARAEKTEEQLHENQESGNKAGKIFDNYLKNGVKGDAGNNFDISERDFIKGNVSGITTLRGSKPENSSSNSAAPAYRKA